MSLDSDVERVGGHLVVRPARAALESALLTGVEHGLVVAESGLRLERFTAEAWTGSRPSWPSGPGGAISGS